MTVNINLKENIGKTQFKILITYNSICAKEYAIFDSNEHNFL